MSNPTKPSAPDQDWTYIDVPRWTQPAKWPAAAAIRSTGTANVRRCGGGSRTSVARVYSGLRPVPLHALHAGSALVQGSR